MDTSENVSLFIVFSFNIHDILKEGGIILSEISIRYYDPIGSISSSCYNE